MKPAQGYLTNDGQFYHSAHRAQQHDAEMEIRLMCAEHGISPERLLPTIEAMADPILEYLHAGQKARDEEATNTSEDRADEGQSEITKAILTLTPNGHEPVSDLGSGPPSKTVSNPRSRNGS